MSRLSDLLARLLGQPQGQSEPAERSRPARGSSSARPPGRRAERGSRALAGPAAARASGPGGDAAPVAQEPRAPHPDEDAETTSGLTLDRMETMITDTMGYGVQRHAESGHPCLLGTWDSYPFVIEIPEGHEGWLLVSGDWDEPVGEGMRDELASSVNDWNRDKFFPTVSIIDSPSGSLVRATYLIDLSSGVTDTQLRLHLETALSSCTQALSLVRPLLPEL
ncbi:type III secretion system chaperone family protein [Actinomyces israelii]|uniref:YbjN domain-containing protein n=1 Tax=Actinomyces israelii TaxID=1659 RepID=UPI0005BB4A65|nr:YbjN domain-containing protein [Actinomyces israelii]